MRLTLRIKRDAENMKDPFGNPYSSWVDFARLRSIAGTYEFEFDDFSRAIGRLVDSR